MKKLLLITVVAFAVAAGVAIKIQADVGPPSVCQPVGCPGGTQVCAYVHGDGVIYVCYEKKPQE